MKRIVRWCWVRLQDVISDWFSPGFSIHGCMPRMSDSLHAVVEKKHTPNAAISGVVESRTPEGPVGDIERSYCLGCRREIPTESGHLCPSCANAPVRRGTPSAQVAGSVIEHRHGFPCTFCGAKTFEEAADLCRGLADCPGDTMSKEVFDTQNAESHASARSGGPIA